MKKYLKVFFVGILVLSMLIACSKPNSNGNEGKGNDEGKGSGNEVEELKPEEGASLILWDNADAEQEWAKYVAEEFEKKYGVPVEVQHVNHTDSATKLKTDGPAGLGADVFNAAHDHLGALVTGGLILPNLVSNLDEYKNDFIQPALDAVSYTTDGESKLYGFPIAMETYALYYNKDLVDQPATTWDELIAQSKEFQKDSTKAKPKYGFMYEVANFYYVHAFLSGYGGYVFGDNNTDPTDLGLNNEGAVKAGQFLQKIHNEILPMKKEDISADLIGQFFKDGQLLYTISGPWSIADYKDAGVNFGVVPLPKLENGEVPNSFSGVKAYYVNAYSKYPKAATLLAQFASSEEMLMKRFEMTGQIPPQKALLESDAVQSDEYVKAFSEQLQHSTPMPNIPAMPAVWGPMEAAFTTIWNENADPKAALDSATKQIEDAIKSQSE